MLAALYNLRRKAMLLISSKLAEKSHKAGNEFDTSKVPMDPMEVIEDLVGFIYQKVMIENSRFVSLQTMEIQMNRLSPKTSFGSIGFLLF